MQTPPMFASEIYVPHLAPRTSPELQWLESEIEKNNLKDMWDMILMMDYQVATVHELTSETLEEFCGIVTLLLKAFSK